MRTSPYYSRFLAAVLSLTLSGEFCLPGYAVPVVSETPASASPAISVPEYYGKVIERYSGTSQKTLIYIQDAHDSLEAQQNIARLVRYLVSQYGVKSVYEEGYEGPVPADEYFGFIKEPEMRRRVAYYFLDRLRLGGAEYAYINRNSATHFGMRKFAVHSEAGNADFKLIGADNIKSHLENIRWYREAASRQAVITRDLDALSPQIEKLANQAFPEKIKIWLKIKSRLEKKEINLVDYLKRLSDLAAAAESPEAYPSIQRLLRASASKDKESLDAARQIETQMLFDEMTRLEDSFAASLLKDARSRKTFDYYEGLQALKRLNRMTLTESEYAALLKKIQGLKTRSIAAFISRETKSSVLLSKRWEESIQCALRFYETAKKREQAIEGRMGEFMNASRENIAVLIYGGFHKEGIQEILKRKGISVVIVTPRITRDDLKHRVYYKKIMSESPSLQKISALPAARAARALSVIEAGARSEIRKVYESMHAPVPHLRSELRREEEGRERMELPPHLFNDAVRDVTYALDHEAEILKEISPKEASSQEVEIFRNRLAVNDLGSGAELARLHRTFDLVLRAVHETDGFSGAWRAKKLINPVDYNFDRLNELFSDRDLSRPDLPQVQRAAALALDQSLFFMLTALSLRIWDEGNPNENLRILQSLLSRIQGSGKIVYTRYVEQLFLMITADAASERYYDDLYQKMEELDKKTRMRIAMLDLLRERAHLGYWVRRGLGIVDIRWRNYLDYQIIVRQSRFLLEHLADEDVTPEEKKIFLQSVLLGLSTDAPFFFHGDQSGYESKDLDVDIEWIKKALIRRQSTALELWSEFKLKMVPLERGREVSRFTPLRFYYDFGSTFLNQIMNQVLISGKSEFVFEDPLRPLPDGEHGLELSLWLIRICKSSMLLPSEFVSPLPPHNDVEAAMYFFESMRSALEELSLAPDTKRSAPRSELRQSGAMEGVDLGEINKQIESALSKLPEAKPEEQGLLVKELLKLARRSRNPEVKKRTFFLVLEKGRAGLAENPWDYLLWIDFFNAFDSQDRIHFIKRLFEIGAESSVLGTTKLERLEYYRGLVLAARLLWSIHTIGKASPEEYLEAVRQTAPENRRSILPLIRDAAHFIKKSGDESGKDFLTALSRLAGKPEADFAFELNSRETFSTGDLNIKLFPASIQTIPLAWHGVVEGVKPDAQVLGLFFEDNMGRHYEHVIGPKAYARFYIRTIAGKKTLLLSEIQNDAYRHYGDKNKKKYQDWRWVVRLALEYYARAQGAEVIISPLAADIIKRWPGNEIGKGIEKMFAEFMYDRKLPNLGFKREDLPEPVDWEAGLQLTRAHVKVLVPDEGLAARLNRIFENMDQAPRSELREAPMAASIEQTYRIENDAIFLINQETLEALGERGWLELLALKMLNEKKLHIVIEANDNGSLGSRALELLMKHRNVYLGWGDKRVLALPKRIPVIGFRDLAYPSAGLLRESTARKINAVFGLFPANFISAMRLTQDPMRLRELMASGKNTITSANAFDLEALTQLFKQYEIVSQAA